MEVILNGKNQTVKENTTIEDFLNPMEETLPKFFVIEHNGNIVYKEDYKNHALKNGDKLEIVMFTGGG